MARSTARVLALLEFLQSGGTWTVARLADRLGVDERTVRRYVGHLLELDVPVRSTRGRYGGYWLAPGYRMPPLMLTDEEAVAVLLGLRAGFPAGSIASAAASAESAAAKIRRVLPTATRRRMDALLDTTADTAAGTARAHGQTDVRVLLTFAEAARDRQPVAFDYGSRDGHRTHRTVAPYGIVAHSGRWYVVGHDDASDDIRTFRLDRVTSCAPAPGTFAPPAGFDPVRTVLDTLANGPWAHEVSVRVRASAAEVSRRLPPGLATIEEINEGNGEAQWVRIRLRAERLEWVPSLLAGLDRPLVVERPPELRQMLGELGARLASYAAVAP